jgi:hypothetical protein
MVNVPNVKLNNGLVMPLVGLGTWGVSLSLSESDKLLRNSYLLCCVVFQLFKVKFERKKSSVGFC